MIWILAFVLAYHGWHEWFWHRERTELINKLMSRNFHDYQFAKNVEKTMVSDTQGKTLGEQVRDEMEGQEDLAPLNGFGMN